MEISKPDTMRWGKILQRIHVALIHTIANSLLTEGMYTMNCTKTDTYDLLFRDYPDVVSISQLSQMLGISDKTAYRLLKGNQIPHFKIGRSYRIPKLNILNYISVSP